jgi:hypothetical protein
VDGKNGNANIEVNALEFFTSMLGVRSWMFDVRISWFQKAFQLAESVTHPCAPVCAGGLDPFKIYPRHRPAGGVASATLFCG